MYERKEQVNHWEKYILIGPVQEKDEWCRMQDAKPYGEIIMVPDVSEPLIELGNVGGSIIRSKKVRKTLLLQVVPTHKKCLEYAIINTLDYGKFPNTINVVNLNK